MRITGAAGALTSSLLCAPGCSIGPFPSCCNQISPSSPPKLITYSFFELLTILIILYLDIHKQGGHQVYPQFGASSCLQVEPSDS